MSCYVMLSLYNVYVRLHLVCMCLAERSTGFLYYDDGRSCACVDRQTHTHTQTHRHTLGHTHRHNMHTQTNFVSVCLSLTKSIYTRTHTLSHSALSLSFSLFLSLSPLIRTHTLSLLSLSLPPSLPLTPVRRQSRRNQDLLAVMRRP